MTLLMSKKLKYFIVCYETRCINHAAEQLCITRSPLARILSELEEKTDGKLFVRKYNHLEPTELSLALYEKIKPVYDLLCAIENEFNLTNKCVKFELLCDISVPYIIYQHISSRFKNQNKPVTCRRVSVSNNEIQSLTANPEIAILSFRQVTVPENFNFHKISDEALFLLVPENISDEDMRNFNMMKDIKLFIRKDVFSSEIKGGISRAIRSVAPYIDVKETDYDTASLLIYVSTGEGIMLLPECLISYFSPPRTRKIEIPNIRVQSGLYVNKRHKNKAIIEDIKNILTSFARQ